MRDGPCARVVLGLATSAVLGAWSATAHAEDPNMADLGDLPPESVPPPSSARYLQYGVAFTGEFIGPLTSAGPMCDEKLHLDGDHCILASGGGIAARVGWRSSGPWYFGGAYEVSKQDPNKLYRLAILHQLRGEARYYFRPELQAQPFLSGGLGIAGYGDEFDPRDTYGPLAFLGGGVEVQISRRTVFIVGLSYRAILFRAFTDSSGAERPSGIATLLGIDIALEARDPI